MVYASTREQLNKALSLPVSIHADDLDDIEWHSVVQRVSRGRVY
jgi:cofilin